MHDVEIKEIYQDTFSEVHAPASLCRKVMEMSETGKKAKMSFGKRMATAAAVAMVLFVGSNGIAYATIGNSLLKTVMVYLDGSGYKVHLEEKVDADGVTYYEGSFEDSKKNGSVTLEDDADWVVSNYEVSYELPKVIEEEGKQYLVDKGIKLDITNDLKDGSASGSYEVEGVTNYYEVAGVYGLWEVNITN